MVVLTCLLLLLGYLAEDRMVPLTNYGIKWWVWSLVYHNLISRPSHWSQGKPGSEATVIIIITVTIELYN